MLDKKKNSSDEKLFINTLLGNKGGKVPIWFMRQAGRYLSEYMKIRNQTSNFLEFCYSPDKASEVTLQPIDRFDFDAAIIFSDILVIPDSLGMMVEFVKNEGPQLGAIENSNDIKKLKSNLDRLQPVYEAISMTRSKLANDKALIGFAGAPWTLATYMIEGGSSRDFQKTKTMAYADSKNFAAIIDILIESVSEHLINQVKAGADALQIFDSWAGTLSEDQFTKWVINPTAKIVQNVKAACPSTPIIGFPKGSGVFYKDYALKTGVTAISFDQNMPCDWISQNINIPVQGNLDPILLFADKEKAVAQTKVILEKFKDRPFIFNLGHGILQHTPIENVQAVVNTVKSYA
jgi:uroporphyrinogen decarboxylase